MVSGLHYVLLSWRNYMQHRVKADASMENSWVATATVYVMPVLCTWLTSACVFPV